ncbi:secreted RxLR effector protein 161-like [Rutidosis leptorrhynchoides]|uniref:secreted RxLR effector protein 161-like n=1 Tax=Rutidosis leptorrhynchoides TaxID=125765 RepID=UPI003A9A4A13
MSKTNAKDVLERFSLWEENPVDNPIVPSTVLTKVGSGEEVDAIAYKRLVGSLMYLTVTRPNLMYVVSLLSRFMSNPKGDHPLAAKRVLRYIKSTFDYGLVYGKHSNQGLKVYTDSDYARDAEDRRCTSGYVCLLSGAAICWSSRKQDIVTLLSTEAEYVAATACACHSMWLKGLLGDMGEDQLGKIVI